MVSLDEVLQISVSVSDRYTAVDSSSNCCQRDTNTGYSPGANAKLCFLSQSFYVSAFLHGSSVMMSTLTSQPTSVAPMTSTTLMQRVRLLCAHCHVLSLFCVERALSSLAQRSRHTCPADCGVSYCWRLKARNGKLYMLACLRHRRTQPSAAGRVLDTLL